MLESKTIMKSVSNVIIIIISSKQAVSTFAIEFLELSSDLNMSSVVYAFLTMHVKYKETYISIIIRVITKLSITALTCV